MTEPQSDRTAGEVRVRRVLPHDMSAAGRAIALGVLLALYPLAQFLGAPVIGGLSDRFGRKPTLLVSLTRARAATA